MNKYKCLVIDPPWNQGKTGKRIVRPNQDLKLDYPTMTKAELLKDFKYKIVVFKNGSTMKVDY